MNFIRLVLSKTYVVGLLLTSNIYAKDHNLGQSSIIHTQTLELASTQGKHVYSLHIHLPKDYNYSKSDYPIVILSDADFSFPLISGVSTLMGARDTLPFIAVAISYSKGDSAQLSRTRDYTPTYAPNERGAHSLEAQKYSGQASAYMDYIEKDVLPYLLKHYRIDLTNKIYAGHSFGGLLGLSILFERPELFDQYIIGSPSLWYDNAAIFNLEKNYAKNNKDLAANVLMYIGANENKNRHKNMVDDVYKLHSTLLARAYPSLELQSFELQGASHFSAFPFLLVDALPRVLKKARKASIETLAVKEIH
ncbi:alpha/beta hydrolase [Agaribacterium sp. ZY112]|uniref:alpha/beta hydrolase n=1 Tax=Agaribacterium sp. ZY112 TaxID=3233574 RepID=UPI003524B59B